LAVGSLRYRVPAEVPMAVIAAACAVRVFESIGAPQWRRAQEILERSQEPEASSQ